jgi:hypothetical protein
MNVLDMSNQELIEYMDSHIDGCCIPNCSVCEKLIDVIRETAARLNVHPFVPRLQKLREREGLTK